MHTNRLINESSPYLLQHAHNPVDWYPWGEEAFEKALKEDKPVLVSIGYAACHWCHVMEKESFENEEVAALMNREFINIKVDREERPDVDHIYMDAVQAITGSGGWPLNVFLTPDKEPFYGGTYFPPVKAYNRPSWTDVLLSMAEAFREKKGEVLQQAGNLMQHLNRSNSFGSGVVNESLPEDKKIDEAFHTIMKNADREWGGFGRAPKFPQSFTINFLLQYAHVKKNDEALQHALLCLDKMSRGGIYDQAGGGFSRYATDNEWLAPHFEKMLYDNALLVSVLADAYCLTGKEKYRQTIEETLVFIERELMDNNGGFYSALDADSEGEEGKFYVWTKIEVDQLLGEDAAVFCAYYDITENGNWEEKNILRIVRGREEIENDHGIDPESFDKIISSGKKKLFEARSKRIRPQLDDKIILGWNALMNIAYSKAFAATGNEHYKSVALKNMDFMLHSFKTDNDLLHHTSKNGKAKYPAFLDDYANLIAALIELSQMTADYFYLDKARDLTMIVLQNFVDEDSAFFFFTHKNQVDIPVRKKEIYDGATPSGNAIMAYNLYRLSILFDIAEWKRRSEQMLLAMGELVIKYAASFSIWLSLLFEMNCGTAEIAIVGKEWKKYLEKVQRIYISHKLAQASANPLPGYPLLADKAETSEILIYVCKNYACRQPVTTIQEFVSLLQSK